MGNTCTVVQPKYCPPVVDVNCFCQRTNVTMLAGGNYTHDYTIECVYRDSIRTSYAMLAAMVLFILVRFTDWRDARFVAHQANDRWASSLPRGAVSATLAG